MWLLDQILGAQQDLPYVAPFAQDAREAAAARLAAGTRRKTAAPQPPIGLLSDWGATPEAYMAPEAAPAPAAEPTAGDWGADPATAFAMAPEPGSPAPELPPAREVTLPPGGVTPAPAITEASSVPRRAAPEAPAFPTESPGQAFLQRLNDNRATLLALAGGFAGARTFGEGMRRAFSAAAPASVSDRQLQNRTSGARETYNALIARGVPPNEALAASQNPAMLKSVLERYGSGEIKEVNGRLVRVGPNDKVTELANFSTPKEDKIPSGYRLKANGNLEYIPGGPEDPAVKRATGDRMNAPPGYRWEKPDDPNSDLIAIKGGPAEKVDATVAARLGLAQSYLDQLPSIKEAVQKGEATGLINTATGHFNIGRAGELRRQAASGAEALLRNLTGAGMNLEEARKYVGRYEIQDFDTKDSVMSKLGQLERELKYTMEAVKKGRGGTIKIGANGIVMDAEAPEAASGGLGVGGSTTINGVTIKRLN